MRPLTNFNFKGKRVLVRCDFNVPLQRGKVLDDFKIRSAVDTINYLREKQAKIILLSHLGSPKLGFITKQKQQYTLMPIQQSLAGLLNTKVQFVKKCIGKNALRKSLKLKEGEILLLENLRFHKGEQSNNQKFACKLAKIGDCFVNEAISCSHRRHASIVLLPSLMPHFAGINFQKEYDVLCAIKQNPTKPVVFIIGGAKVESKARVVKKFLSKADHVLLGGKVANVILAVKGVCLSQKMPSKDIYEELKLIKLTDSNLHLPFDVKVSSQHDEYARTVRQAGPANVRKGEAILDIGEETAQAFSDIISEARTIFWAGVMGIVEDERYIDGTKRVLEAIVENKQALKVAGGGETISFIRKFGAEKSFSFLLTGGGASLDILSGDELPGIKALE